MLIWIVSVNVYLDIFFIAPDKHFFFSGKVLMFLSLYQNISCCTHQKRLTEALQMRVHMFSWRNKKNGSCQEKRCLRICAKCADSDHPAHTQSIIRAFALHSYFLVSNDLVSRQWRSSSDCADAQVDTGLSCPPMLVFAWRGPHIMSTPPGPYPPLIWTYVFLTAATKRHIK